MNKLKCLLITPVLFIGLSGSAAAQRHYVAGDINKDGVVNARDLSMLLSSYGQRTHKCVNNHRYVCDLNHDHVVNIYDLNILISNYNKMR